MKKLWLARNGYGVLSCIFLLYAAVYLVVPELSPTIIALSAGLTLIVYGAIKIIGFYAADLYCLAFQFDFAQGVLLILAGCFVLAEREQCADYLRLGFGWLVLIDSLFRLQTAQDARKFGLKRWPVILAVGIISGAVSACLIFAWRTGAGYWLTVLSLLAESVMNFCILRLTVEKNPKIIKYE